MPVQAQTMSVDEIIAIWRVSDTSQTRRSAMVLGDMHRHFDPVAFQHRLHLLKAYLKDNPDRRLRIRFFMYECFGYEMWQGGVDTVSSQRYLNTMQEASLLNDEQLMSELYTKYAEYKPAAKNTFYYLLKAIEIRQRIGIQCFPSIFFDYYTISAWRYEVMDYRASANYGVKGVNSFQNPEDILFQYILALDVVGASYLKMNQPDSAMIYYQKLKTELDQQKADPARYQVSHMPDRTADIWRGIALGGIGQALLLKGQYDSAYTLLQQDLQTSERYQEWINAAVAETALADIDYGRKNYRQALARYRRARAWAHTARKLTVLIPAIQGMSSAFASLHASDSALVYQQEYMQWKDSLQRRVDANHLAFTHARVEYEHMQSVFAQTQKEIAAQKRLRNIVLAGIAVAAGISLLLYNRSRLKHKLRQAQLESEKQQAQAAVKSAREEVTRAQHQLEEFVRHMAEKNKKIEILEAQLSNESPPDVHARLQNFTILTDDDWSNFKQLFLQAYPGFQTGVSHALPDLSPAELRFLALYKLNLTQREMAAMLGVSEEAVRKQNYRLRKKLESSHPDTDLKDFVGRYN